MYSCLPLMGRNRPDSVLYLAPFDGLVDATIARITDKQSPLFQALGLLAYLQSRP